MLERQLISIPFGEGIDTKSDDKQVPVGKLRSLENGVFTHAKSIKKRSGYRARTKQKVDTLSNYSNAQGIASYYNETLLFADNRLLSYSSERSGWVDKGPAFSVNSEISDLVVDELDTKIGSVASNGTYTVVVDAKEESAGYVRSYYRVYSQATGAVIYPKTYLSDLQSGPRAFISVYAVGNNFVFVWSEDDGTTNAKEVFTAYMATSSLGTVSTPSPIVSDYYKSVECSGFCAFPQGNKLYFAYEKKTGGTFTGYIDQSGALGLATSITTYSPFDVYADATSGKVFVATIDPSSPKILRVHSFTSAFVSIANLSVISTALGTVRDAKLCRSGATDHVKVFALMKDSASVTAIYGLYSRDVSDTANITSQELLRNTSIGSTIYWAREVSGHQYVLLRHTLYLDFRVDYLNYSQQTFFVINEDGDIVSANLRGNAGGFYSEVNTYSNSLECYDGAPYVSGSKVWFGVPRKISIKPVFYLGVYVAAPFTGISQIVMDFDDSNNVCTKKLGKNLFVSGGYLSSYDGQKMAEYGFHIYPSAYSFGSSVAVGSTLKLGNYAAAVIYEWTDSQGVIQQSAPSYSSIVNVATNNTHKLSISADPCNYTLKDNVKVQFYLSLPNLTDVLYLAAEVSGSNMADLVSAEFSSDMSAASLGSSKILYTTGGIIENIAPSSPRQIELFKQRIVAVSDESPYEVQYSKEFNGTDAVGFNESLVVRVDQLGGKINCLKFMDDKLLVFKDSVIFAMVGDGPNNLGSGGQFSTPELIASDVGCPFPNSLVLMPEGVMFKSNKGFYLINRQLQVEYRGAAVEGFNDQTVMSADLIEDRNQIRFLHSDGSCLVYDYYFNQWSTFTNHAGKDAMISGGVYTYLRNDGSVYVEDKDWFQDATTPIKLRIVTAWIKLNGLQGFQRVRRFGLLGTNKSDHALLVKIAYDYNDYFPDSMVFDAKSVLSSDTWGSDATWGAGEFWGGSSDLDSAYQFRGHMPRQKCESVSFWIEDQVTSTSQEAYSVEDLSIEIGVKRGLNKLKLSKTVG